MVGGHPLSHHQPKTLIKQINPKKIYKTPKPKTKSSTVKTISVKEQYLNLLSTNSADLKHKAEDLKNKLKYFNSSIFAVQETHFRKKGMFKTFKSLNLFGKIKKWAAPCLVFMWV